MENADKPANTEAAITQPRDNWWTQLIRYAKSKMDERAAKKQKEPPTDRAAGVAARATVWIAIFTLVSVAVSVFTFVILRRQLKEMHDGGVDTHTLAQQAVTQTNLLRQQVVGAQAAVLKVSRSFDIEGFVFGLTNIRDVDATEVYIRIVMTPIILPNTVMSTSPVVHEVRLQRIEKDNPFAQRWPIPWPIQREAQEGWPGKRTVKIDGEYSYQDGFGTKMSGTFCDVWLPILNIVTKRENATVGGSVPCDGIENTIRDILASKHEADTEKKKNSPN